MNDLSIDIVEKIKNDFKEEDWSLVFEELQLVSKDSLNVGHNQLIRSMITLSQGSRYKILNIRRTNKYFGDPKDVILMANTLNPKSDFGRKLFDIGEFKKGWVNEYWTTNRNLSKSEALEINKWVYDNIFTNDQYNLKYKERNNVHVYQYDVLEGETFAEMKELSNPFDKLPNQTEFERSIYRALKDKKKETSCYTFTFRQSAVYYYDLGIYGEYEFENKSNKSVGSGALYPIYANLFNDDVGNSYEYNYALGTGLVSKKFDWYILIHFKNEKEKYIETVVGGDLIIH